jgi:phenylacetate-CoA ligase
VGDTGSIAGEGPDRDGLTVWGDAQYVEICDIASGAPLPACEKGDMVVTSLYKDDVAPVIRFNTHDVSALKPGRGTLVFDRIEGFLGRSDNMVKLKGINIFPHAIGAIIENRPGLTGEYVCVLERLPDLSERLTVVIEARAGEEADALRGLLRQRLGVEVAVELVAPGETAAMTEIDRRQKPIRLVDRR